METNRSTGISNGDTGVDFSQSSQLEAAGDARIEAARTARQDGAIRPTPQVQQAQLNLGPSTPAAMHFAKTAAPLPPEPTANAAGLSKQTLNEAKSFAAADGQVDIPDISVFYMRGEVLSALQDGGDTPLDATICFGDFRFAEALISGGANPWLVGHKGLLPAAMLQNPGSDPAQEPIRKRLLAMVETAAPPCPPPSPTEIFDKFANGSWPGAAMRNAGFIASEEALASIRQTENRRH